MKTEIQSKITAEEIKEKLSDAKWRINNLYYIKNEKGDKVLFKMNPVQNYLFDNLWFFTIVPKARQLGITTFFAIMYFDQVLFGKNISAGIIAHRQEDMKKIFRSKIRFAWDNLHPWLREYIGEPNTDSANELSFPNGSVIFVTMTTRSGTVQYLHVSEFGYTCQKYPEKAEEIVTGAMNSVHAGGMVSIESTAAGREGYFYDFCMDADRMRKEGRELTPLDFKIFFFPWYLDDRYFLEGDFTYSKEDSDYFRMLGEKHNVQLTREQQNWYVKKKKTQKAKMFAEYPSTLDEAFQVNIDGAYYTREMEKVYLDNRIRPIAPESMIPVESWWDLGMNDFNVILLTQTKGDQIRFINMYWNRGEKLAHYYDWLKEQKDLHNYRYSRHHFPHDVEVKELGTGVSRRETLYALGLRNMMVGKKMPIVDGIDRVRILFPRFIFDEEKCVKLYESLFNYRKDFDHKLGVFKDRPRHDENCLAGETEIRTLNGWIPIKELEGQKDFWVWSYSKKEGRLIPVRAKECRKTGSQEVIEVGLDNNISIHATKHHRFMLRDGSWKRADNLKKGDSLMPFYENDRGGGYIVIDLNDGSTAMEHQYIYSRLIGDVCIGHNIDHINNIKTDNRPENLQSLDLGEHCSKTFIGKTMEERRNMTSDKYITKYSHTMSFKDCRGCGREIWVNYKTLYCSKNCSQKRWRDANSHVERRKRGTPSSTPESVLKYGRASEMKSLHKCQSCDSFVSRKAKQCRPCYFSRLKNHKVRFIGGSVVKDVYDIEVPKYKNFVANGVVVHNSHFADPIRLLGQDWKEYGQSLHDDDHLRNQSSSFF